MRAVLIASLVAASAAIFLAACTTTPTEEQTPAPVIEGKIDAPKDVATPGSVTKVEPPSKPLASQQQLKTGILSQRSIYYDFDKFDVKDEYRGMVEAHAKYLRENPGAKVLIQGNTDERGGREYNVSLGQRRSDGVKRMLILLGAKEAQIESVSLGEEKPRAEGHAEDAWAKNRRSDILYSGEY
jgi:peptidoglycan-associated lipoprotein